ncbi:PfkB family carbohydrate kinase [Clostridium sp. AN503]|uniref:PfkB family carbohydrate kinase n=1 Tax=Clostridium sp. AN503 TaxID=3160598 RepID=UPI00345982F6
MNIKDIANLCGVSPSTVSKILHDKDDDISVETRRKVLEVIKKYQYVPYSKVLKNAAPKTNTIGVLISEQEYGAQELLYHIERTASENGYSIMLCNTSGDVSLASRCLHILNNKGVDGIISIFQEEELLSQTTIPAIRLDHKKHKTSITGVADIYFEMTDAGYLAVSYLFEKGHRKIACLLSEEDNDVMEGYLRAFKEQFLSPDWEWLIRGNEEDLVKVGIPKCLEMDVTAIICTDVETGNIFYEKLRARGDVVPDNISVISVRNSRLADRLFPKMAAVHIPSEQLGKESVDILIELIEGKKSAHEYRKKAELEIVERGSVVPPVKYSQGGKIVVVGSMNMDCMISVGHIPTGGETLKAGSIVSLPGGKGANQAVGAGKLGGLVYMVGRLGNDSDGKVIYNSLVDHGVRTDGVIFDDSTPTGKAYINVASNGESTIVIYPGANEKLGREQVKQFEHLLDDAKYCLLTLEIEEETVEYTIRKCQKKQVEVILKPSAVEKMKESLFGQISYFVPNEKELKQLLPGEASIEEKAVILLDKGVKNVIITLGEKGCYFRNREQERYFPAADFFPVDTTGAADAFIAALAVYLSEGKDILQAISFATYAAGISITRQGVQSGMVDRQGITLYQEEIAGLLR